MSTVNHVEELKRFVVKYENGDEGFLEYKNIDGTLDLFKTFIPESQRGKGQAEVLTRAACEYVRDQDLKMIPTCSYIEKKFLINNPEFAAFVKV